MKIKLKDIATAAELRPAGYLAEVMATGKASGDSLVITAADYARLFAKYRDGSVAVFEAGIARAVDNFQANCGSC